MGIVDVFQAIRGYTIAKIRLVYNMYFMSDVLNGASLALME